jgi:raffinose/stachyose/melibiose transport system substrate-binding protein
MTISIKRMSKALAVAIPAALVVSMASPASAAESINFLTDNGTTSVALATALAKAFTAANPSITVNVTQRPGGTDGDNLVKTRLSTGTMDDVFLYNSGSLFQAINPTKNLVDLTNEPWQKNILTSFYPTVSAGGKIYGAPLGSAMAGGMLYNKDIFAKVGITKVPTTWTGLINDCKIIKKAGIDCIEQTYGDTWTSQLLILGDFFNTNAAVPTFAADYTANKAKFANTPAAAEGFGYLEQVHKLGYLNRDFPSAKFTDGLTAIATGKAAIYPMLTAAAATIDTQYPKANIGFFAQPGPSSARNGATIWMPAGVYIPNTTKHLAAAKAFVAYIDSPAGIAVQNAAASPTGPYLVKGATLPSTVDGVAKDLLGYFKMNGHTAPALEFISPVKGPNLEKITVQVGSGQITAAQAATAYDQDVKAEAQQLGLPGW